MLGSVDEGKKAGQALGSDRGSSVDRVAEKDSPVYAYLSKDLCEMRMKLWDYLGQEKCQDSMFKSSEIRA